MKNFLRLIILSFFICKTALAQDTFLNKYYPLSSTDRITQFLDVLYVDDSITVFGQIVDDTMRWNQNAFIARFDTLGNLSKIKILYHPDDLESVIPGDYTKFSTTNDGGYMVSLVSFDEWYKQIFYKLDKNLKIEFTTTIRLGTSNTNPVKPVQIGEDYYLASSLQNADFNTCYGLTKVNKEGKIVWNKDYLRPGKFDYLQGIKSFKPGVITLIGSKEKDASWGLTISELDTAGNILNEIYGEKRYVSLYFALDTLSDGGFIHVAHTFPDQNDIYTTDTRIYRIDAQGKTVWERIFPTQLKNWSYLSDMERNLDGSYTIVGKLYGEGVALRISQDGDIIWRHQYRNTNISDTLDYIRIFNSSTILPGGNIIGCGIFNHNNQGAGVEQGWLAKIRPDGCIDDLCKTSISTSTISTFVNPIEGGSYAEIYPNPSNGSLNINLNSYVKDATIVFYDINGRKFLKKKLISGQNDLTIDGQVSGMIGYNIYLKNGTIIKSGKLIIIK